MGINHGLVHWYGTSNLHGTHMLCTFVRDLGPLHLDMSVCVRCARCVSR